MTDTNTPHPARFTWDLLPVFSTALVGLADTDDEGVVLSRIRVLDPFAGTGRIHKLAELGPYDTIGIEIEPEWAAMHERTFRGNALALQFEADSFDAVVTSPTYGNRFADKHTPKDASRRRGYTHDLGRQLHEANSGAMQWGEQYRDFHRLAWAEVRRVLKPEGRFVLNLKDHIRKGDRQYVAGWHVTELCRMGFDLLMHTEVEARGMRDGANHDLRVPAEQVYVFELPKEAKRAAQQTTTNKKGATSGKEEE
jgi:SAM-dependent methyltransferase